MLTTEEPAGEMYLYIKFNINTYQIQWNTTFFQNTNIIYRAYTCVESLFLVQMWLFKRFTALHLSIFFLAQQSYQPYIFQHTAVVFLWASQVGLHVCINIIHLHKHKTAFPQKINKTNYISSPVHHLLPRAQNMCSLAIR